MLERVLRVVRFASEPITSADIREALDVGVESPDYASMRSAIRRGVKRGYLVRTVRTGAHDTYVLARDANQRIAADRVQKADQARRSIELARAARHLRASKAAAA